MYFFKSKTIYREDHKPYMKRFTVFYCKWFSIKFHQILLSDYSCMHDHPWAFITFLIRGGYVEYTPGSSRLYGRFSLLYRPADYVHRLEIHQPVWSIVISFKKIQAWGFYTKKGWVHWRGYTSTNSCE